MALSDQHNHFSPSDRTLVEVPYRFSSSERNECSAFLVRIPQEFLSELETGASASVSFSQDRNTFHFGGSTVNFSIKEEDASLVELLEQDCSTGHLRVLAGISRKLNIHLSMEKSQLSTRYQVETISQRVIEPATTKIKKAQYSSLRTAGTRMDSSSEAVIFSDASVEDECDHLRAVTDAMDEKRYTANPVPPTVRGAAKRKANVFKNRSAKKPTSSSRRVGEMEAEKSQQEDFRSFRLERIWNGNEAISDDDEFSATHKKFNEKYEGYVQLRSKMISIREKYQEMYNQCQHASTPEERKAHEKKLKETYKSEKQEIDKISAEYKAVHKLMKRLKSKLAAYDKVYRPR